MDPNQLDARSRTILLETINDYIVTAEPVGSRTLSKKLSERLSPATVRNVMSDLEEMGYLHQPHTSSGRVPTDQGYRYFVNQIQYSQKPGGKSNLVSWNSIDENDPERLLDSACNILSTNSNQTGLVMMPSFGKLPLKSIEFVKIGTRQVMAVLIAHMGVIQNRIIQLEEDYSQDKLTSVSKYLNAEFSGLSLKGIQLELKARMHNEREHYGQLMEKATQLWTQVSTPEEIGESSLRVEGLNHLLGHPDFTADLQRMQALMKTVEEKNKLVKILDLCMKHEGLSIVIGQENSETEMQDCSIIAQNYQVNNETVGAMAIFGPKRMDYMKMIGIVNSTANNVSDFLSKKQ